MKKYFSKEVKIAISVIVSAVILYFGIEFLKGINLMHPSNYYYIRYDNVAGLTVEEAYDADRDVAFWQEPAEMCHMVLSSGSYAILPPSIAHKPGMRAGSQASPVKKCVGKVRVH